MYEFDIAIDFATDGMQLLFIDKSLKENVIIVNDNGLNFDAHKYLVKRINKQKWINSNLVWQRPHTIVSNGAISMVVRNVNVMQIDAFHSVSKWNISNIVFTQKRI